MLNSFKALEKHNKMLEVFLIVTQELLKELLSGQCCNYRFNVERF